jgi:hypothetical protein
MQLRYIKSEQERTRKEKNNVGFIFLFLIDLLNIEFFEKHIASLNYCKYHFREPKIPC